MSRGNRELVRIHTVAEGVAAAAERKADVVIFERCESDEAGKLLAECYSADIRASQTEEERLRSQALIDELTNRTIGDTWPNR